MARRNGIAGQLPFGAPVARDSRGIGGRLPLNAPGIGGMLPLNAAPGIGGCRSVGIGAHKTGVSNLALATRRQARGALGRVSAGGTAQGPVTGWARCMQRLKGSGHGCSFKGSMSFGECSDACKRMAGWYSTGGGSGAAAGSCKSSKDCAGKNTFCVNGKCEADIVNPWPAQPAAPAGVRRLSAGGTARGGSWVDCWKLCQQTSNPALCVQTNCGGKTPPPPPIRTAGGARPAQPAVRGRRALTYKGGGIGKSYASRLLGKGVTVDVTRTGEGSYSATITTQGKSMAKKVLGDRIQGEVGTHENGYHGSVGIGGRRGLKRGTRGRRLTMKAGR